MAAPPGFTQIPDYAAAPDDTRLYGTPVPPPPLSAAERWAHRDVDADHPFGGAPAPVLPHQDETAFDYAGADRRREAIGRLTQMSFGHAVAAWQMRRKDPIEPYGLALLYTQPDERPWRITQSRVTAATRLWLDGTGATSLPDHLFRYAHGLPARLADLADIRQEANRRDLEMLDTADYIGVGVSSLDTVHGPWRQAIKHLSGDADVAPGQAWIVLVDGTVIVIDRGGTAQLKRQVVHTTGMLEYSPGHPPYAYRTTTIEALRADPLHQAVLHWLDEINSAFWGADWDRMNALRGGHR